MSKYKFLLILGSPPHTWRIPKLMTMAKRLKRITSTYVENTKMILLFYFGLKDHLHIRGEYGHYIDESGHAERITSTYVENTNPEQIYKWLLEDHLHIRGEYSLVA